MEKAVEIVNLNYVYPDGTKAIEGMNLTVEKGSSLGIIGSNGAGKTTLLLHLNGIFYGSSVHGSGVKIFGEEVNKKNIKKIRRRVGLVFQNPDDQLFMPTVFEDIAFGLSYLDFSALEIKKKVSETLSLLHMEGYEDKVSHHLSDGEKKKISLATVLVLNPDILVFDEPTINLDPASKREFIELLKKFDHTKIIASHDLDMIKEICDKVIVMSGGRCVGEGKTLDILENKTLLAQNRLM
ncbi:MAG: ABC transporter ATP-binding protein [Elusimicrobiota bacterium]|nr:ABC transporter ATP-binding protein [Elusimicrobiota bacterium]